ncbi:hypothetical protein BJQ90_04201 [Arthrobacter sp. SO3]|nr:hypothetical protein [Arthrobacter sp. SO3]
MRRRGLAGGELLPLIEQAGVDLADQFAEPRDEVLEVLAQGVLRDGLPQRFEAVGKVAQHDALRARQSVELDELAKVHRPFVHVPDHGLGGQFEITDPRGGPAVDIEGLPEDFRERLRVGDLLQHGHALVVLDAVGLHRGDRLTARLLLLCGQDLPGLFQRGLNHGDHVQGVGRRLRIQQLQRREGEGGQRLVQGEVGLQMDRQTDRAAVPALLLRRDPFHDSGGQQFAVDAEGPLHKLQLGGARLMVFGEQPAGGLEWIARPFHQVHQHRVGHGEAGRERIRDGFHEALVGRFAPGHEALGRLLLDYLAELLLVVAELGRGLGHRLDVLGDVLGGLHHDRPGGVVAGPSGASGDLVEFAGVQQPGAHAVVLAQRSEQHGADGDVDAHTEGVGPADDLEQPGLGELFHQPAVFGQHAGVVHADAVPDQPVEGFAKAGREAETGDQLGDLVLLLAGADVDAHQVLGPVNCLHLAEVHHVDGHLLGGEEFLQRLVHWRLLVVVVQRDGPLHRTDGRRRAAGQRGKAGFEAADVAERGGHQQELRLREFQQRDLPGPAALRVGVEVELVHDDGAEFCGGTLAEGDVGQDLRGAADDRGVLVDAGVAGDHADVLGAEDLAQGEELLRDERLDGSGVVTALSARHGLEVHGDSNKGFAGTGGGRQDHVGAGGKLHDGLVLGGVEGQPAGFRPLDEAGVELVRVESGAAGDPGGRGGELIYKFHCSPA